MCSLLFLKHDYSSPIRPDSFKNHIIWRGEGVINERQTFAFLRLHHFAEICLLCVQVCLCVSVPACVPEAFANAFSHLSSVACNSREQRTTTVKLSKNIHPLLLSTPQFVCEFHEMSSSCSRHPPCHLPQSRIPSGVTNSIYMSGVFNIRESRNSFWFFLRVPGSQHF